MAGSHTLVVIGAAGLPIATFENRRDLIFWLSHRWINAIAVYTVPRTPSPSDDPREPVDLSRDPDIAPLLRGVPDEADD